MQFTLMRGINTITKKLVVRASLCNFVLTVQALGEFVYATTRKNLLDNSRSSNFVNDWFEVFEIVSATDSARLEAIDTVRNHQMSFRDANAMGHRPTVGMLSPA